MATMSEPMSDRVIELDLSGPRSLVFVDGELLAGVSSAMLEINAFETPVLSRIAYVARR